MSGVGFFELVILFMIGLVVLGPKRLPQVANQLGTWIGQARRMTRTLRRQLEEELNVNEELKDLRKLKDEFRDDVKIGPAAMHVPRSDDSYSPMHDKPLAASATTVAASEAPTDDATDETADAAASGDDREPEKTP